jgi:uncharacterized phage protein gp47/JayE
MAYAPIQITAAGITINSYSDILDSNLEGFLEIYGNSQYVSPSSAVYEMLAIISLKQSDVEKAVQLAYNQSSPLTAIGTGLDRVCKMNGIARLPFTYSTALVTITGVAGTVINNGFVQDTSGNQWALPTTVMISLGGSITVNVTCTTPGNVVAEPGTITIIASPVGGWTSATNGAASVAGNPVESDSKLRARQAISVALPSSTRLDGTIAGVAALAAVTRSSAYENPTGATSDGTTIYGYPANAPLPAGLPPHSLTMVVEGGTDLDVATAIYQNRGIGPYTNGTTSVNVTDPNTGYITPIRFYRPSYVPIFVSMTVHGLQGFTTATLAAIKTAIVNYLNSLEIGELVTASGITAVAMSVTPNLSNPQFTVRSLTLGAGGSILTVTVGVTGGNSYFAGNLLVPTQAGSGGANIPVVQVAFPGDGHVEAVSMNPLLGALAGYGYTVANNVPTTGGQGSGAEVDITSVIQVGTPPTGTVDIPLLFSQVAEGINANVIIASV